MKQVHSNFSLFSFRCLSYPDLSVGDFCALKKVADVVVGGFGAPDGLFAGVEGEAGALKLFTFCCLYFVYLVVALQLFSFRCLSYPDLSVGGFCAPNG